MGYLCREHKHRSTGKCRRKQSGQVWWYTWDSSTQKAEAVAILRCCNQRGLCRGPCPKQKQNKQASNSLFLCRCGSRQAEQISQMAAWDLILRDAKGNDTVEERKVLVEELSCMNRTPGSDCQVLRKREELLSQRIAGGARNNPVTKVASRSGGHLNESVKVESKEMLLLFVLRQGLDMNFRLAWNSQSSSLCLISAKVQVYPSPPTSHHEMQGLINGNNNYL